MVMNEKHFTFEPNLDPFYLLSENSLFELIFMASAVYFTVSTELRLEDDSETQERLN